MFGAQKQLDRNRPQFHRIDGHLKKLVEISFVFKNTAIKLIMDESSSTTYAATVFSSCICCPIKWVRGNSLSEFKSCQLNHGLVLQDKLT